MADETLRDTAPRPAPPAAGIKVGVITEAKGPHLSAYFRGFGGAEGVEQVAVADASGTTFAEAKTGLGQRGATLRTYSDYRELLREFRPALALVSLAADRAPEPIMAALEAGCHVVAEKPACVRAADFEAAVKVAERKQRYSVVTGNDTFFGASFSPDGSRIAFTGVDKSIRLFDASAGKEIRRIDHHEDWAFGAVFGVDGKRIVSVSRDRAAKLTDVETGRFIENVNLLREPLTAIARHPKKDWVLVGGAERVPYLYKMDRPRAMRIADDSTLIRKFEKQDGPILVVAISPDGDRIAVGSETGDVRVYNLETGDQVAKCSGHQGGIYSLQFHPSGRRLAAAGFDGMVRVYDLQGTLVRAFSPVPIQSVQSAQR